jgi:hypothetical protein
MSAVEPIRDLRSLFDPTENAEQSSKTESLNRKKQTGDQTPQVDTETSTHALKLLSTPPTFDEDEVDRRLEWKNNFFSGKKIDILVLDPKGWLKRIFNGLSSLSSATRFYHRSSESIAQDLIPKKSFLTISPQDRTIQDLASAIKDAREIKIKTYDIAKSLVDFLYTSLKTEKYSEYWEKRLRFELERSTKKNHHNDSDNYKRSKYISDEVALLAEERTMQKASGIVYYLLCDPYFDTENNWLKACVLRMGNKKRQGSGIAALAQRVRSDPKFIESKESLYKKGNPHDAVRELNYLIKGILNENGYAHVQCSNKEEAANILKEILEGEIVLLRQVKSEQSPRQKGAEKSGLNPKNDESIVLKSAEEAIKDLELLLFVNSGQCSSSVVCYQEWHQKIKDFFLLQSNKAINRILEPILDYLSALQTKYEDELKAVTGKQKERIQQFIEIVKDHFKVLNVLIQKNKNNQRIVLESEIEYFESSLFILKKISLQMLQGIFNHKILTYYDAEKRVIRDTSNHLLSVELQNCFEKHFLAEDGPWRIFLIRYFEFSSLQEETQEFISLTNFHKLAEHEVERRKKHSREASESRGMARVGSLIQVQEKVHAHARRGHGGVRDLDNIKDAYERRRFYFSPIERYFMHMYIMESDKYQGLLTGDASKAPKAFNEAEVTSSVRISAGLRESLTNRIKLFFDHDEVKNKLFSESEALKQLNELKKEDPKKYYEGIEKKYIFLGRPPARAIRLLEYPLKKNLDLQELGEKLNLEKREFLEEKSSGASSLKGPQKPTEESLIEKELDLMRRIENPLLFKEEENQKAALKILDELLCSTLDLNDLKMDGKRKKTDTPSIVAI